MSPKTKLPKRLLGFDEKAPKGFEYLAMVNHGWARDPDLLKAVKDACFNGTRGSSPASGPLLIMLVGPGTRINGMGSTVAPNEDPEPFQIFAEAPKGNEKHNLRLSADMIHDAIDRSKTATI